MTGVEDEVLQNIVLMPLAKVTIIRLEQDVADDTKGTDSWETINDSVDVGLL